MTLLSIEDVKYDILNYPKAHPNIQIMEMSTKYYKNREKGPGLKDKGQVERKIGSTIKQTIKELIERAKSNA